MAGPVGVEELTARRVQALIGMCAKVVALRLQQIRGQTVGGVAVEVAECRRHSRSRDTVRDSRRRDFAPRWNQLFHRLFEIRVKQQVAEFRILVIRFLDLVKEHRPDDAAAVRMRVYPWA